MRVKIIASKPIDNGCSGIKEYIGKEFEVYEEDGMLMAKNSARNDFILFNGEYEVISE